jgi:hypothetical protein
MSCGCKSGNNFEIPLEKDVIDVRTTINVNTIVKWVIFLILTILSPVIAPPLLVYALYGAIILNKKLDAIVMFSAINKAARDIYDKKQLKAGDLDGIEIVTTPINV